MSFFIKKGQTEIMGLMIFSLLLFLGIFFLVLTSFNKDTSSTRDTFLESELAITAINSITEMTVNGEAYSRQLIRSVSENDIVLQNELEEIAKDVFNETFDKWQRRYLFNVSWEDNEIFSLGEGCVGYERTQKSSPFPVGDGTNVEIIIELC